MATNQVKVELTTMPNEERRVPMRMQHRLTLPVCCPVSRNPRPGSNIALSYLARDRVLEVFSLHQFINQFVGGHPDGTRNMEAMIQRITQACANAVGVKVRCEAYLALVPAQSMTLRCCAIPDDILPGHPSTSVVREDDAATVRVAPPAVRPEAATTGNV